MESCNILFTFSDTDCIVSLYDFKIKIEYSQVDTMKYRNGIMDFLDSEV